MMRAISCFPARDRTGRPGSRTVVDRSFRDLGLGCYIGNRAEAGRIRRGYVPLARGAATLAVVFRVNVPESSCRDHMIVIIDYGMGNLRSVQKAIETVGDQAEIT